MPIIQQRVEYERNYEAPTPRNIMQPFVKNALGLHLRFAWTTAKRKRANCRKYIKYSPFL